MKKKDRQRAVEDANNEARQVAWAHLSDTHVHSTTLNAFVVLRRRNQRSVSIDDLCQMAAELSALDTPAPEDLILRAVWNLQRAGLVDIMGLGRARRFSLSYSGQALYL